MLKELYKIADYKDINGMCFNVDCMQIMRERERVGLIF